MTALVLVVAGVAAGDGGMRTGAAHEPVRAMPRLDVRWAGSGWVYGRPVFVRLDRETLVWGDGSYLVGWLGYDLQGDRLTIRGYDLTFHLRPAAPKP